VIGTDTETYKSWLETQKADHGFMSHKEWHVIGMPLVCHCHAIVNMLRVFAGNLQMQQGNEFMFKLL